MIVPENLKDAERELLGRLDALNRAYRRDAEPILRRLAAIYAVSMPEPFVVEISQLDPALIENLKLKGLQP